MLSFIKENNNSKPLAQIRKGKMNDAILFVTPDSKKGGNEAKLTGKATFIPFIDPKKRGVYYIAGPSGSGKSTYATKLILSYKFLFPDNKVFVFSRLPLDKMLEELGCIEIPINEQISSVDSIKHISNALCLFDDIDTIPEKKLRDLIDKLMIDILETGRHNNTYIIVTSHLINGNDKKKCRTILNEAQQITIFPRTNSHAIRYLLKEYIDLNKKQIDDLMKTKSRWITIDKEYPQVTFNEKGAKILNE